MAQTSLNIYLNQVESAKDNLAEILKGVVENIQVGAVSEAIKNKNGSGNPEAGVINYKRFKNATLNAKGTARTAGAGVAVKDVNIPVNMNDDKEIVEELQTKDIKLFGVPALVQRRAFNQARRIQAYLDTKFFATAKAAGTAYAGSKTDLKDILDDLIVSAKTTASDYIDGIDIMDLCIVGDAQGIKALKNDMDALPHGTVAANAIVGSYDGIDLFESNRMPSGTHWMVMLKGAVAEPWFVSDYQAEKVPFDDAIAVESFLYVGAAALNPEAIYYYAETISA